MHIANSNLHKFIKSEMLELSSLKGRTIPAPYTHIALELLSRFQEMNASSLVRNNRGNSGPTIVGDQCKEWK